ncbi:MAG: type I restriction enzyme HsdR N-terminal domain-containing protein [Hyphomicrobiales bacterium]
MTDFWATCDHLTFANESEVGTKLILPMLAALGYDCGQDVKSEASVDFTIQQGRRNTRSRADYFVFSGEPYDETTSLITIELKSAEYTVESGKRQAESYAHNHRTPIVLLCNGSCIELWQLQSTNACNLLLEVSEGQIAVKRDELEALLSKEAIVHLAKSLTVKDFNQVVRNFSAYQSAELSRLLKGRPILERKVSPIGPSELHELCPLELTNLKINSVVIAKSGFGKTTFANALCVQLLQRRNADQSAPLPVAIALPELCSTGQSVTDFTVARLAAHNPAAMASNLKRLIDEQGMLLVLDGLNRVTSNEQRKIIAEINAMLRDHTNLRVAVFSARKPIAQIENANFFELREFQRTDLEALASLYGLSVHIWSGTPKAVDVMAKIPVLAKRLVEGYHQNGVHFQRIEQVFDNWLEEGLVGLGELDRGLLKDVLFNVADATRSGPIKIGEFYSIISEAGADISLRESAIATGLINIAGNTVELVHETMATYLRAVALVDQKHGDIEAYLSSHGLVENHLFAAILMAVAPDRNTQSIVWNAILKLSLPLAISAVRYRYDLSNQLHSYSSNEQSTIYLSDLLQAIGEPTTHFFRGMEYELHEELSGYRTSEIGIAGVVENQHASYTFFDASDCPDKVIVDNQGIINQGRGYGDNLVLQGLRADSGRIVGLRRLKEALINLCDERKIKGDHVWREERCLGRFRYLQRAFEFSSFGGQVELRSAIELLEPQRNAWANDGHEKEAVIFSISELIDDLQVLLKSGVEFLQPWWLSQSEIDLQNDAGQQVYATMVDQYYKRAQAVYFELIASFAELKRHLRGAQNRPHRYTVLVEDYEETWRIGWKHSMMPVANLSEAGADVYFEGDTNFVDQAHDWSKYAELYRQRLIDIGRFSDKWSWSYGNGYAPNFSGEDTGFGKVRYETAAMSLAMKWFKEDIANLFSELPAADTGHNFPQTLVTSSEKEAQE